MLVRPHSLFSYRLQPCRLCKMAMHFAVAQQFKHLKRLKVLSRLRPIRLKRRCQCSHVFQAKMPMFGANLNVWIGLPVYARKFAVKVVIDRRRHWRLSQDQLLHDRIIPHFLLPSGGQQRRGDWTEPPLLGLHVKSMF